MIKSPALRIALGSAGVSIWSPEIFQEPALVRVFLARAFAVPEVGEIELRRAESFGRIRYGVAAHPARIWRKLSRALDSPGEALPVTDSAQAGATTIDASNLYLDGPRARRVRVSRIGNVLSTWRVRQKGDSSLSLSHSVLRNRRDLVFRLEEELSSILGVEAFRASSITGRVSIHFDRSQTTAERLARALEKAWPRVLEGVDGLPSRKRLFTSVGLAGLAYTGQYVVPALRPLAVAGVTLYSSPNVVKAAKQLTRGQVGVSALYTAGLTFMLISGLPFTASVMAAFMQLWPQLAHRKLVASRRVFVGLRRRAVWARIVRADGAELEVEADDLRKDDLIVVRRGEPIAVDGVVESGSALVVDLLPFGEPKLERRAKGEAVVAGAFVRDGELLIRVDRAGPHTLASPAASQFPGERDTRLPSLLEAERIADRNAKPALALCALSLLLTRTALPAQAAIRPDYATAPRLSAQLSVMEGIADGLLRGIVFRNPAALDRLAAIDRWIIDATAGLGRRQNRVAQVEAADGVSPDLVVAYALAAQRKGAELWHALSVVAARRKIESVKPLSIRRQAGVTRYRDRQGALIEIATAGYFTASKIEPPQHFQTVLVRRDGQAGGRDDAAPGNDDVAPPLWVRRDGKVIGALSFAPTGDIVGRQVVSALAARDPKARIIYVSSEGDKGSRQLARTLDIEFSERTANDDRLRRHRGATMWIGDGRDPGVRSSIAASTVSVSVAPSPPSFDDRADILLPNEGVSGLPGLFDIAARYSTRLARDYRTVYAANLLGVGGAFVVGLNTLEVGLLSNIGTGLVYARHALTLSRLAAAAEQERSRLKRAVFG
jgi:cation transport ATPase